MEEEREIKVNAVVANCGIKENELVVASSQTVVAGKEKDIAKKRNKEKTKSEETDVITKEQEQDGPIV